MTSVSERIRAAEHLRKRHYTHLSQGKWNDTKSGKQLYSYAQTCTGCSTL